MQRFDSIFDLTNAVGQRSISAVEVVRGYLDRIERIDRHLNAFREVYADQAIETAQALDAQIAGATPPGPLAGVPVAIKDNIVTEFGSTACGSRMLEHYQSPFSATVVERLLHAGAIIIGKTNCDEFAMGSSTETCAFGPTLNPWDLKCVPGGSSGGSAAAVAANMCPIALGSDTGGSIRQPAAFCGVVGVKPSYGRVSRYGLVAFGSSFDQVGPIAQNVRDAAAILGAIAGLDRRDSTSSAESVPDYLRELETPVTDLRIGVPQQYKNEHNHPAVNAALQQAVEVFKELGATIIDIDLPLTDYGVATYYVIAPAEASSNLARFDGIRYGRRAELKPGESLFDLYARSRSEGFGPEVQRRIMLGTYVLSAGHYDAYYKRAQQVRRLIKNEFDAAFKQCHALLGPVAPTPPFPVGAMPDLLATYLNDIYTVNTSIAGICGIALPAGYAEADGTTLPIGIQLQCQYMHEPLMFRIARMFERATSFHLNRPALAVERH